MSERDARLIDLAIGMGVRIEYGRMRREHDGVWLPERRLIRIRPGLHARHHRTVLAHEVAHAVFGDVPSPFGPMRARQERRAEDWAALQLIDVVAYERAEEACEGHAGAMAVELGVMRSTVEAFRGLLERIQDHTYVAPRMGTGQWTARVDLSH